MAEVTNRAEVAVIGLGAIGLPVAINLAKKGVKVHIWNRSDAAALKAMEAGAIRIASLSDIDAPIVLSVLPDMPQVDDVLANGLSTALQPGDIFVVMGTVSPVAVRKLGDQLHERGVHLLDAPVSGGDVGAQNATLSIMVGGDIEVLKVVQPIFEKIGSTIRHLGPLGSGEIAKACNQIVVAVTLSALAEALTLGRKSGLDDAMLLDILAGGLAGSKVLEVKRKKLESGDFTPGGSALFQLKDLKFALEAGVETGTALPVTSQVASLFNALIEAGDGALDHSAIIREIERRSK
jgi:2-hydroxy-3-oxopropionate reductase